MSLVSPPLTACRLDIGEMEEGWRREETKRGCD